MQPVVSTILSRLSGRAASGPAARYGLASVLLVLAVLLRMAFDPWLHGALSHPTVFTAVLLAAWWCGVGPAVLVAILGYPAIELFVISRPAVPADAAYFASSAALYSGLAAVTIFFVRALKSAQAKLQASERLMRATFDNAALGIYQTDAQGRLLGVNRRMCEILGYRPEELVGKHVGDTTAEEDRAHIEEMSTKLSQGLLDRFDYDKRIVKRDGSRQWVHVTASAVRDDAGRFLYAVRTVEDIEERKRAEQKNVLLSQAIETAANSIVLTDRDARILWVNPAFTRLTGYTLEEAASRNPSILKSGRQPGEFYRELWETILGGRTWHGRIVNRRKDGSLYDEEMTITPVRATGSEITHFVAVKQDVTERMRAEESLRTARLSAERAKKAAEEASRAKDRFLAVLSHELRTPLTPVLAAVQLIQRMKHGEELRQPLEIISRNVQLEARLIDDLLDLTRIAQGKIVLQRRPIDLCTVVERAVETSRADIDARRLHFGVELGDAPLNVEGDPARLQQVIWNLLTNAVKFSPNGGCLGVRCRRENGRVLVEVSDSGIGIEPGSLEVIFNAFEQGGPNITREFGGLGLGLAIAKRLVQLHGGTITAHSEGRGKGATFRIALPAGSSQAEPLPAKPGAAAGATPARILLVEDNGDTAITMKLLLEACGYSVLTAGGVSEALERLAAQGFDLLVSDLGLPDESGLELIKKLRQRGNALKAIALSGYGQEEDVARSRAAGFSMHLTKPVDADALLGAVSRVLDGSGEPDSESRQESAH